MALPSLPLLVLFPGYRPQGHRVLQSVFERLWQGWAVGCGKQTPVGALVRDVGWERVDLCPSSNLGSVAEVPRQSGNIWCSELGRRWARPSALGCHTQGLREAGTSCRGGPGEGTWYQQCLAWAEGGDKVEIKVKVFSTEPTPCSAGGGGVVPQEPLPNPPVASKLGGMKILRLETPGGLGVALRLGSPSPRAYWGIL